MVPQVNTRAETVWGRKFEPISTHVERWSPGKRALDPCFGIGVPLRVYQGDCSDSLPRLLWVGGGDGWHFRQVEKEKMLFRTQEAKALVMSEDLLKHLKLSMFLSCHLRLRLLPERE